MFSRAVASALRTCTLVFALGALSASAQAASTPELSLMGMRDALVRNDLRGLVQALQPPSEYAAEVAKADPRTKRAEEPELRAMQEREFDEVFGRLIAPDASQSIMNEVRPGLEEMRPTLQIGQMALLTNIRQQISDSTETTPEHKAEYLALLKALELYFARVDLLDPQRFERSLQEMIIGARAVQIQTLDQLESLGLDGALTRFAVMLQAGKRALGHYELDADQILRSARFRTLKQDDKQADVEMELTVLDVRFHATLTLYAREGGWYFDPPPPSEEELAAAVAAMEAEAAAEAAAEAESPEDSAQSE